MKFLLILLSVVVIILAQRGGHLNVRGRLLGVGLDADLSAHCISRSGATQADIQEIQSQQFPSQRAGKCLLSCIEQAVGIQEADGQPTLTGIAAQVLENLKEINSTLHDQVLKVALTCGSKVILSNLTDSCDLAFEMALCGVREAATVFTQQAFGTFVLNAHI